MNIYNYCMKLDCILTTVNENKLYLDFIPIFIQTWNKLYPHVDVKIILIANQIPENLIIYQNNIILFNPIDNVSTAFISQYIRLLYQAILNYENGTMISDIDILPMNGTYYIENIDKFPNDKFIYLRDVLMNEYNQIAMCYNVATNKLWGDIFGIKSLDDIRRTLINKFNSIHYVDGHGSFGWSIDQIDLYNNLMKWNADTNNLIVLNDNSTGFFRLDRDEFILDDINILNNIKNRIYTDYHCCHPFKEYEYINNKIYELL